MMGIPFKDLPDSVKKLMSASPLSAKRQKYGAKPVVIDGIRFASTKEGEYYKSLKLRQRAGDIVWFLMQVPFALPGGVQYRLDFLICEACGRLSAGVTTCNLLFVDVKGFKTKEYRLKKRQVEALYPGVKIEEA